MKSGAKARRLRGAGSGSNQKWNKREFESRWYQFLAGRKPNTELVLQFQNENKKNLRMRHERELNLMISGK